MIKILVSSCLLGERVRYDGRGARAASSLLRRWREEGRLVPCCPEVAAGLPVPRPAVEIEGAGGLAVLRGEARVVARSGGEATTAFVGGARRALEAARDAGARLAILKDGSPSCGSAYIYDGSFTGARRPGQGVTAALLEHNGIRVFSETRIGEASDFLAKLEGSRDADDPHGRGRA